MFLFVVLFGLSMDYHVFVVSRIELALRGLRRPGTPCREAIVSSAGTVTSAAVVMVAVFAIFATLTGLEFKQQKSGWPPRSCSTPPWSARCCCRPR